MLEIKNLTKTFGDKVIYENFSLNIQDNTMLAIVGGSGTGKTTLLNIIGLLDNKYNGQLLCDGKDMKSLNKNEKTKFIRENVNYLFQNYALIDNSTVEDNLMLALYYSKASKIEKKTKIKYVLTKVGLADFEKKKIYMLSGGEQQRVALARVMLKRGKYILADEPTGNLDEENRNIVFSNLQELHENGFTVIIVTHDKYIANKCTDILYL